MSLESELQQRIVEMTNQYWTEHSNDQGFSELINGKEPGHRMADFVDDRTCSLLKVNVDTRYEGDRKGEIRKRSMGDIWVNSQGIFNPVNVKSGLQGQNGQPNVVSMQKLLDYLFAKYIDSYYLLIVKFDITDTISHSTYLVDLLDWIDCVTYDAGPGQIMLKEKVFYEKMEAGFTPPDRTVQGKVEDLFQLFETQLLSLISNRQNRIERQRNLLDGFLNSEFVVDQSAMRFVP